jgi:hypothetical protein
MPMAEYHSNSQPVDSMSLNRYLLMNPVIRLTYATLWLMGLLDYVTRFKMIEELTRRCTYAQPI